MASEDLAYALTQVVHNFGAAGVVGGAFFALWPAFRPEHARLMAWLVLAAWSAQIGSGIVFGAVSLYNYGQTPDLSAVAMGALVVKVTAAAAGFLLSAYYLLKGKEWSPARIRTTFRSLGVLGATALTAAAFLRWFA